MENSRKISVGDLVYLNSNSQNRMTVTKTSGLFLVEAS